MTRRLRQGIRIAPALLALVSLGCSLEQRLKSCRDLRIDLVNALPSEGPVHIAAEGEPLSDSTLLPAIAGGSSRSIVECVERGDSKRFRAAYGTQVVAVVACTVSHSSSDLEGATARVVWGKQGLACEGW